MSECQFWWNWWVQFAVAAGTLVLAFAAIWGRRIESWLFRPKLILKLLSEDGTLTYVELRSPDDGTTRTESARYYHLHIRNAMRWPNATNVQVVLFRVDEPGPDGVYQQVWAGAMPMRWAVPALVPPQVTVGQARDCDLLNVVKGKWLALNVGTQLNNLKSLRRVAEAPVHWRLHFEARSDEGNSNIVMIFADWDGQWADDTQEMKRHLVVREE
jgi:hypothetical protein